MSIPSVGVCVNGAARTLRLPSVYNSIRCSLLEPLRANGRARVVPFAVLTVTETHSADNAFNRGAGTVRIPRWHYDPALAAIGVTSRISAIREHDWSERELDNLIGRGRCSHVPRAANADRRRAEAIRKMYYVLLAQLATTNLCLPLIQSFEERAGWRFDFLMHARPDAMWVRKMPPLAEWAAWAGRGIVTSSNSSRGHCGAAIHDWAAFGKREAMQPWFDRLSWVRSKPPACNVTTLARRPRELVAAIPVAAGLVPYFKRAHVPLRPVELPQIVRRSSGSRSDGTAMVGCTCKASFFGGDAERCFVALYEKGGADEPRLRPQGQSVCASAVPGIRSQ